MKKVVFKAEYVQPQTEVIVVELTQMIAGSPGGGQQIGCVGADCNDCDCDGEDTFCSDDDF